VPAQRETSYSGRGGRIFPCTGSGKKGRHEGRNHRLRLRKEGNSIAGALAKKEHVSGYTVENAEKKKKSTNPTLLGKKKRATGVHAIVGGRKLRGGINLP